MVPFSFQAFFILIFKPHSWSSLPRFTEHAAACGGEQRTLGAVLDFYSVLLSLELRL